MTAPLVLDLYAGAGGWDEGASMLGLPTVGLELEHDPCVSAVRGGHLRVRCDVSTYPTSAFAGRLTGITASPPCTTFSGAGSGAGRQVLHVLLRALDELAAGKPIRAARRKECQRAIAAWALAKRPKWTRAERAAWSWEQARSAVQVLEPLRYVRDLRPEWVALEQVRAVLPIWRHYVRILRGWGYSAWTGILNSADFGVPQTRERAILIASRVRAAVPPEPTHAREPVADLFGTRERWVSMADALGWHGIDRPARTVCGDRGPRWAYGQANSYATGWTLNSRRDGPGWVDAHGERDNRDVAEPAPTVTGEAGRWELDRRTNSRGPQGTAIPVVSVPVDRPAPTLTTQGHQWVLRNNSNSCERGVDEPSGTLFFGARCNDVSWVLRTGRRPNSTARRIDEPAPTVYSSRSGNIEWTTERPATTVQGDPRIGRPGHKDREGGETQFGQDPVRITIVEAAVLQSFRQDYPWYGTKTSQFLQVGNAFPPRLAAAVCGAATGRDWHTAVHVRYGPASESVA